MKAEITTEQAIGKTVKGFLSSKMSPQMVVYFDDDTFTTFEAYFDESYAGSYEGEYRIVGAKINWFDFGHNADLFKAAMLSEQEWLAMCNNADRLEKEATEQRERSEYERLKAKYED